MNSLEGYQEVDSSWFGQIPTQWRAKRFKYLTQPRKELSQTGEEELLSVTEVSGIVKRRELRSGDENLSRSENLIGYRHVKKGDLVSNIMLVWKRGLGVSPYDGIVSPAYSVFTFNDECYPGYYNYLVRSDEYITEFRKHSTGITMSRLRLYDDSFGSVLAHLPPLEEQKLISQYLDKKTEQIDRLVERIQKKIELLKEQRTSLINQCVTKGLDPNVEMKDSGVEWIGEIPSHWDIISLRYCAEMLRGKFSHRPRNDPDFYDGDYPFIQTGDISKSKKYLTSYSQTLNERGYSVSKEFPIDTLVMGIAANIGNVCILKIKSCFPDSIVGFYPRSNWKIDFLYFLFSSMTDEFIRNSIVSTQLNLNIDRIGDIKIPMVPPKEQEDICSFLDKSEDRYDHFLKLYNKKIQKLHEYRQSLISSAVTGKVRVTEDMI